MNVVHLVTLNSGGAGRAVNRLNAALNQLDKVKSKVLVLEKKGNRPGVKSIAKTTFLKGIARLRSKIDNLPLKVYRNKKNNLFSVNRFGVNLAKHRAVQEADIINLHWINKGFISIKHIHELSKLGKPLVWTLRDMWPFTGGCHYSSGCSRYEEKCGKCPVLGSNKEADLSRRIWKRKNKYFQDIELQIIALSKWIAGCADNSSLFSKFDIDIIPNPIDTAVYKPVKMKTAKEILNLDKDKTTVLFGAINAVQDERKGFHYLKKSLEILHSQMNEQKELELLVFGSSYSSEIDDLPYETTFLGRLHDDYTISLCYNASDVFVAPSLEDNLPKTPMESLSCGTPVVAFEIGGMPDMIDHKENGYLADKKSSEDLANGILWVLTSGERDRLSKNARSKVLENFTYENVGQQYLELYSKLLRD